MFRMHILLTGATGYIGKRLLPALIAAGRHVVCCVRDRNRFQVPEDAEGQVEVVEVDFLKPETLSRIPDSITHAFYLIHSMSSGTSEFEDMEQRTAEAFRQRMDAIGVRQVIYLSGIVNEDNLSPHLASRKRVEHLLAAGNYHLTTLRAGIILGSGSASFEIMRDLVEKLPVMIAPRWLKTRSQPIAVRNVIEFLTGVLDDDGSFDKSFDIAGPDIMSYREMLLAFARIRGLKRWIIQVPVLTPRLSSYWLYFVTSTSFVLARNLVDSMKVEVIARPNDLHVRHGIQLLSFDAAISDAFTRIEQNQVISSWKDALVSGSTEASLSRYVQVPTHGCFQDMRSKQVRDIDTTLDRIWSLGGETGWYYANPLWRLRGFLDKLFGGVGLRRGRTNPHTIHSGDALDFWRVLLADRAERRLLLFAEMRLPGEAWLEFRIDRDGILTQTATFRPRGISGRLYWYFVWPLHGLVFGGMLRRLAE